MSGQKINGYKVVEGRQGNRKFADEESVASILTGSLGLMDEEIYTRELKTPAVLEKLLKKMKKQFTPEVEACITRTRGKPVLVPLSDKREEITGCEYLETDFIDLDG